MVESRAPTKVPIICYLGIFNKENEPVVVRNYLVKYLT